ncbi:cell division protein FtsL [Pasteurellaceae bacterium 22721_9_1]
MNEPVLNSQRYPLQEVFLEDMFSANKVVIALLLAIVLTALGTIWVTYQTRVLVSEKGALVFEKQALENEYVNLRLEETTLSDNRYIETMATNIGMKRIDPVQEVVILE